MLEDTNNNALHIFMFIFKTIYYAMLRSHFPPVLPVPYGIPNIEIKYLLTYLLTLWAEQPLKSFYCPLIMFSLSDSILVTLILY